MITGDPATFASDPAHDLRHRPEPGGRMRDSLFWQLTMPEEKLGFQAYLYLAHDGRAGFNAIVWGDGVEKVAGAHGEVDDACDLLSLELEGLRVRQQPGEGRAEIAYDGDGLRLRYGFEALHPAFSYHDNPGGLPPWFALDRFEQTGRVTGFLEVDGRRIAWDRIGHRDHSWGVRDWGAPQHWKWFVGYTPAGDRIVNGWIWISRGEWGFAGYVVRDGVLTAIDRIDAKARYDDDMSQRALKAVITDVDGGVFDLEIDCFGVVRLPSNDRFGTLIMEGAGAAVLDGRPGAGQFETHWSQAYLDHLTRKRGAPRG